jgi:Peptidase family M28
MPWRRRPASSVAVNAPEARAERVVREYDAQGWHRTGTETDHRSALWLAEHVRARGAKPVLEPFELHRLDPGECYVDVHGERIPGLPLFDGPLTDAHGVVGLLRPVGTDGTIGLVDIPPHDGPASTGACARARRQARHEAIVAVTRGSHPGLALVNAPSFIAPFGPPVLQVGSEAGARLADAAAEGVAVRVVLEARRTEATATNVAATIVGADPFLPPIAVMTPRSGWWHGAAERGGGLACWLEVLRVVAERMPRRSVHFIATSGHELGHLGLQAYLARRPALPPKALVWLHLGANVGAAGETGERLTVSAPAYEAAALDALRRHGVAPGEVAPIGAIPPGEAHDIMAAGGDFVSLLGSNSHFHLPSDRWPDAVHIPRLARIAAALAGLVEELAR